jgi:hypothetical protein
LRGAFGGASDGVSDLAANPQSARMTLDAAADAKDEA